MDAREAVGAGRGAIDPSRLYAGYLIAQAGVGIVFWVLLAASPVVRSWFELMPERPVVMDAFVFADLVIGVVGSLLSVWAIGAHKSWAVPMVAFTAGAMMYPTLYLVGWVSFTGVGALCLAIMVPPSTLTCWISYQTWKLRR